MKNIKLSKLFFDKKIKKLVFNKFNKQSDIKQLKILLNLSLFTCPFKVKVSYFRSDKLDN